MQQVLGPLETCRFLPAMALGTNQVEHDSSLSLVGVLEAVVAVAVLLPAQPGSGPVVVAAAGVLADSDGITPMICLIRFQLVAL